MADQKGGQQDVNSHPVLCNKPFNLEYVQQFGHMMHRLCTLSLWRVHYCL